MFFVDLWNVLTDFLMATCSLGLIVYDMYTCIMIIVFLLVTTCWDSWFVLIDCHFLLVTICFPCRTAQVRPCWWGRPTSPWNAGDSSTPWGWMWPSWSARSYSVGLTSRWLRRLGTTWRWRGSSSSDPVSPQRWLTTHCFVQMFNLITTVKQLVIHCWKGHCLVMLSLLKYVYKEQHRDMVMI